MAFSTALDDQNQDIFMTHVELSPDHRGHEGMGGHGGHGGMEVHGGYEAHGGMEVHGGFEGHEEMEGHGGFESHGGMGSHGGFEGHGGHGGFKSHMVSIEVKRSVVSKGEMVEVKCSGELEEGTYMRVEKDTMTLGGEVTNTYGYASVMVAAEETGEYRCAAHLSSGDVIYSPEVTIQVMDTFTVMLTHENEHNSHMVNLNCEVNAGDMDLTFVQTVIKHYDMASENLIRSLGASATINPQSIDEIGLYKCEASTQYPHPMSATSNEVMFYYQGYFYYLKMSLLLFFLIISKPRCSRK